MDSDINSPEFAGAVAKALCARMKAAIPRKEVPRSMNKIEFVDQTIRDAQQSLWGLMMRTDHIVPIAEMMDKVGYRAIATVGSQAFTLQVRNHNEDPWERIRILSRLMPEPACAALTRRQASPLSTSARRETSSPSGSSDRWPTESKASGFAITRRTWRDSATSRKSPKPKGPRSSRP